jgi:hypothetical protein
MSVFIQGESITDYKYNVSNILEAVSSFISHHDKEDYEGIFIIARQHDDLYQIFAGGTARNMLKNGWGHRLSWNPCSMI